MEQLKTYIGTLGTWVNTAKTQPLQVDYFLVGTPLVWIKKDRITALAPPSGLSLRNKIVLFVKAPLLR